MLLVAAINLALARHLPEDVTALLEGKRLAIRVRDARLDFDFTWQGGKFAPCARHAEPDLAISANAQDFVLLAQRKQDPDTLFFNRRLIMEGDTELGLVVKNALDALELPVLDRLHPPRAAAPARPRAAPAQAAAAAAAALHPQALKPKPKRHARPRPLPAPGLFLLRLLQRRAACQPRRRQA